MKYNEEVIFSNVYLRVLTYSESSKRNVEEYIRSIFDEEYEFYTTTVEKLTLTEKENKALKKRAWEYFISKIRSCFVKSAEWQSNS